MNESRTRGILGGAMLGGRVPKKTDRKYKTETVEFKIKSGPNKGQIKKFKAKVEVKRKWGSVKELEAHMRRIGMNEALIKNAVKKWREAR